MQRWRYFLAFLPRDSEASFGNLVSYSKVWLRLRLIRVTHALYIYIYNTMPAFGTQVTSRCMQRCFSSNQKKKFYSLVPARLTLLLVKWLLSSATVFSNGIEWFLVAWSPLEYRERRHNGGIIY